jgi:FtsH-binding integral membrane protein
MNQSIDELALGHGAFVRDHTRTVFGQVMWLVALTVGCAALGAYAGRNLNGGVGIAFFIGAFACIFGLNFATARGHEQLATGLLFGLGLLVAIPDGNIIYCVLGLVIFGGFTIFDFNRLRRADMASAVPIAAGIFLDIFNVFLLLLELFGGERR